ncbi:MAG TPA: FAD-binding oxidoreductase [Candidatus Limnocylindrales bacterium]|nr:FAD-binding oxidoreductase [Candidatus Limnocylindrales bacterium]
MSLSTSPSLSIDDLRAAVRGRVITADDPDYEAARTIMYQGHDTRPAAIVRVADAADVSTVVSIARRTGIEVAVRSGGHSAAGHSSTNGGIVIDLRDLDDLDIDVAGRTAWAGSGLTAGEYTTKAAEHGLATGFGDTGSVGLGGLTTGGGVGYLVRKHGLTIDNLLAAEIVTADGQVRIVDADNEPDLFWAVRGGGGNFGVATRFRYRLSELKGVVGGMLVLPATPDTVAGFIAAAEAAPDEVSTIANVMSCPPMPFVPERYHGTIVILGMLAYAGDEEAGKQALAPFRALAEPIADMLAPIPYPQMFPPDDPDYHPTAVSKTMFIDHVDGAVAKTIVDYLESSDASMRVAQLRVLGGAAARVPVDATAYAHRASRIMVNVAAFYEGGEDKPRREAWVAEFSSALQQGDAGAYVNFVGDEGEARVRAAYPGKTWDRLTELKRKYDPDNLFRRNQNIPPAAAGAAIP